MGFRERWIARRRVAIYRRDSIRSAMLAVVGISGSARADLDRTLDRLGTNMLTVGPGDTVDGRPAVLPAESVDTVARIAPVESVSAIGVMRHHVYRTDLVPAAESNSIAVAATRLDLLETLHGRLAAGSWLDRASEQYPVVVLGSSAAQRLGIRRPGVRVWLGEQWFGVAGILEPVPLAPEIDRTALVGRPVAGLTLGFDDRPTAIYLRVATSRVEAVRSVLAATVDPAAPQEVRVSRPSDALAARRVANRALGSLLLALGGVALLVGGIGVANTMVISVLERRSEIGLRRSLGATRAQIRHQFLAESVLLASVGGAVGAVLGVLVTVGYALPQGRPVSLPAAAVVAAMAVTAAIGALAGLYPAVHASRLAPTEALG